MKHVCLLLSASVGSRVLVMDNLVTCPLFWDVKYCPVNSIWDYQKAQMV
jgi:hypothetical protein